MNRARVARSAIAIVTGSLLASACVAESESGAGSGSGEDPTCVTGVVGDQQDAGEPIQGGTLAIADYAEPRSLDPTVTIAHGSSGGSAMAAVYDVLMRYNAETDEYEPWLAESLESDEEFTTWTLELAEDREFSDGTAVDAPAVVGSISHYLENEGSDAALVANHIDDMGVADESTVVFHLSEPWSSFPAMLAQGPGLIIAPSAIEGEDFEPVGAGPFELENYAPEEEMVLSARDDYWGGEPPLDELRFVWLDSDDAKLEALDAGSVDMAHVQDPTVVEQAREAEYAGYMDLVSQGTTLLINHRDGHPGSDKRVREAMAHAIDPEAHYERAFDGAGLADKGMLGEHSRWETDVESMPTDTDRAAELVDAAMEDGYDGELTYFGNASATGRTEGQAVKAALENVGFTVELEFARSVSDQIQRMYVDHDFDLARAGASISDADPFQRLYTNLHTESPLNAAGYSDPEMDELLTELRAAGSDEERQQALAALEQQWNETVAGVPLGTASAFMPWQDNVHGVVPTSEQMLLFSQAWVE